MKVEKRRQENGGHHGVASCSGQLGLAQSVHPAGKMGEGRGEERGGEGRGGEGRREEKRREEKRREEKRREEKRRGQLGQAKLC
jgi:hypothetical protein